MISYSDREPCPYCGRKPKLEYSIYDPTKNIVICRNHKCPAPRVPGTSGTTMTEAIQRWNEWARKYRETYKEEIKFWKKRYKEKGSNKMVGIDFESEIVNRFPLNHCPWCKGEVVMSLYIGHGTIRCPKCEVIMHANEHGADGLVELAHRWNSIPEQNQKETK